jgi:hypothetical protein
MSRRAIGGLAALPILIGAAIAAPQQRDVEFTPTTGTASISGSVVIDDGSGASRPARRTVVTLAGAELRPSRGAITDDQGRFVFDRLPAGRFMLTAVRTSFITSQFGAKRAGRPGTAIAVGAGQAVSDLVVRLWPGAVIAGVIRDERGEPIEGVPVNAIPERPRDPAPTFTLTNNGVETNERGEYRIFGLEPGIYVVTARPAAAGLGQITAPSEAELDAAFEVLRRRSAQPLAPSDRRPPVRDPEAGRLFDYAPTFFPGTPMLSAAARVTLAAGQEQAGLDFAIQRLPTAIVSGRVVDPQGRAVPNVGVRILAPARAAFVMETTRLFSTTTGPDGTFSIGQIAPGDYKIHVRAAATPVPETPGRVAIDTTVPLLWGLADVSVAGYDVSGLSIELRPAFSLSGRIVFEPGSTPAPKDVSSLRIGVSSTTQPPGGVSIVNGIAQGNIVPPVSVRGDGSFEMAQLTPDTYEVSVAGAALKGTSWRLKSAVVGGQDVLDSLMTISPGTSLSGAVFTMSDRTTELKGRLETASGAPSADVFVLAYAADPAMWGGTWRRVQAVRPALDGQYVIRGLPPGAYLLAALTDVDTDEWKDPAFLAQLVPASIKLALSESETKTQNLRLTGR